MKNFKAMPAGRQVFSVFYLFLNFCLLLYSYTQVDLSLTLSKISIFQTIEKSFQYIGWYQRPLSTAIFLIIIGLMFASYFYLLHLARENKLNRKYFWSLLLITAGILVFSYNAFSYDLFNYIFDAKILTHYHQNPYLHKALDFPSDPMLSFMRWTHRTYPYGPIWLGISAPLTFIGGNIFLLTFYVFKAVIAGFFIGTVWALEKISETLNFKNKLFPLVLFAFNPLTIIESLVSSHNDIAMMFFAVLGFYLFLKRRWAVGEILIIISYLVKSVTIFLLIPITLSFAQKFTKIRFSQENILGTALISMLLGFGFVLTQKEIQPWYMLWVLPFAALIKNKFVLSLSICFTVGLSLTYVPVVLVNNAVSGMPYKIQILPVSLLVGAILPLLFSAKSKLG